VSAPTWQESVEDFVNTQIDLHDLDPQEAWREVAEFAAVNAEPEFGPDDDER
jgi:hypothetical protein